MGKLCLCYPYAFSEAVKLAKEGFLHLFHPECEAVGAQAQHEGEGSHRFPGDLGADKKGIPAKPLSTGSDGLPVGGQDPCFQPVKAKGDLADPFRPREGEKALLAVCPQGEIGKTALRRQEVEENRGEKVIPGGTSGMELIAAGAAGMERITAGAVGTAVIAAGIAAIESIGTWNARGVFAEAGRQYCTPQGIQYLLGSSLNVLGVGGDGCDQIPLGIKENVLSAHAVHGEAVADPPELIAIALLFVQSLAGVKGGGLEAYRLPQIISERIRAVLDLIHDIPGSGHQIPRTGHEPGAAHLRAEGIGNDIGLLRKANGIQKLPSQVI